MKVERTRSDASKSCDGMVINEWFIPEQKEDMIIDDSDINDTDHYQGEKDEKCGWRRDNIEENDYEEKDGQNVVNNSNQKVDVDQPRKRATEMKKNAQYHLRCSKMRLFHLWVEQILVTN